MSRIRVGVVSPYDLSIPGGVQAQVLGLAGFLRRQGDEAIVIGPGLPSGMSGCDLGSSVSIPGNGSIVPLSLDPRIRGKLEGAVADLDLLHVHEPLMPLVSLLANHAGPPVVATFHAAPGPVGRAVYRLPWALLDWAMGNRVAITAVSEMAASVLPSRMEALIIPNGLDVGSMQVDTPRSENRVAFLGRDEPRKGLDLLLDAWTKVVAARPDAELIVMGADRATEGVTWLGRVDDQTKARVLSSAAVYVAPQTGGESFGIVLVEAMSAGAAVVASDLDAFVSVAAGSALHFPAGDSQALAKALLQLLSRPGERAELTAAGARRAAEFDWSVVGAAYRDLYVSSIP